VTTQLNAKAVKLTALREAREEVLAAIEGLGDEDLAREVFAPWAAKDLVAHLASWAEVALSDVERISRGHVPVLSGFDQAEVDDWNRGLMRGRMMFPPAQARVEFAELRGALEKALEQVPDAQFEEGTLVCALCDIFANHEQEHAGVLRSWRQSLAI
jgi:hypothetical protein